MIRFEIPKEPILRGYLFAFINSIDPTSINVDYRGDIAILKHVRGKNITSLIAKVYEKVRDRLKRGELRISLSNNDKAIIVKARTKDKPTLFSMLGLTPQQSMEDMFEKVAKIVENMTDEEFLNEYYKSSTKFAPPSLLRIEHYQAGRSPFFISRKLDRTKPEYLTLLQIVTYLAGYVISNLGYISVDGQRRAVLILPQTIGRSRKSFNDLISDYIKFKPPGAKPVEALYLWFALTLPEEIIDISVVGIREPAGANPSSIDFSLHINLKYQKRIWEELSIELNEYEKSLWLEVLKYALSPKTHEKVREDAITYSKLLFRASQGNIDASRELLLRSSRMVTMLSKSRVEKRDLERQKLSLQALKIAEKLLNVLSQRKRWNQ